jgi:endoglucanase
MPRAAATTTHTTYKLYLAAMALSRAAGHGYMSKPPSRNYEAYLNNGWDTPGADEYGPHSVRAAGMFSECADCPNRGFPGVNPWSAPGTASSVAYEVPTGKLHGVCGASWNEASLDYNAPSPDGVWGTAAKTTYAAGETITVEWCVSADHGGVPAFRLCDDPDLVAKVTTAGAAPSLDELLDLEACFQRGTLRCDGAAGADCGMVAVCGDHGDWEACADEGEYLHCRDEYGVGGKAWACINTAETCAHGSLARYELKIPEDTKPSPHTVLSFRWDTYENNEVFSGCADVEILAGDGDPSPTPKPVAPAPTPRPVATPTPAPVEPAPTPAPGPATPAPTDGDADGAGTCCFWSETNDACACGSVAPPENWCAASETQCLACGATWCASGSEPPSDGDPPSDPDEPVGECVPAPESAAVNNTGYAAHHGALGLDGVQLVDARGDAVQLLGMSSHGLHWFPDCYGYEAIAHLVETWGINVFRAAMYVGEGGYATDPSIYDKVQDVVAWTKELGVYVVIDFHVLTPGDPNAYLDPADPVALDFWTMVAEAYKDETHVIYEIANEPNNVAWDDVLTYHNAVIGAIRAVDADTIIVAGTTTWSQDIHLAAAKPVDAPRNVMYAFHFYACSHQSLLARVEEYRTVIPIFVSEWGTSDYSGNGATCVCDAREFLDVFSRAEPSISMAQWSWADKAEASAALNPGACAAGAWDDLSESGVFLKKYIQKATETNANNAGPPGGVVAPPSPTPEPTAAPPATTAAPVPKPTLAPVPKPTLAPTPKDTCEDDSAWYYKKESKDCAWVAKKPNKRCRKKGILADGSKTRAKKACLVACDKC